MILSVMGVLLLAGSASAQTPVVPGDKIGWDQQAGSLAEAAGYSYLLQVDALTPTVVAPAAVTCTGAASPYLCTTTFPAATPGASHSVKVAARIVVPGTPAVNVDSPFSTPLVFQLVVIPGTPVNVRRIAGE
jgi:hypothetical protein